MCLRSARIANVAGRSRSGTSVASRSITAALLREETSERMSLHCTRITDIACRGRSFANRSAARAMMLGEEFVQKTRLGATRVNINVAGTARITRVTVAGLYPRHAGNDGQRGKQDQSLHGNLSP